MTLTLTPKFRFEVPENLRLPAIGDAVLRPLVRLSLGGAALRVDVIGDQLGMDVSGHEHLDLNPAAVIDSGEILARNTVKDEVSRFEIVRGDVDRLHPFFLLLLICAQIVRGSAVAINPESAAA